ncbi:MAG: hypothetical protein EB168_05625 [Euryarchaeota archaeon]|jgi:hypothetical protein|nr:hypothetical protein [Euryarchaeota archaeon]
MTTDKLFNVVGTSTFKGMYKVRFATDMVTRFKTLHKGGHQDIEMFELPEPMNKADATQWLKDNKYDSLCQDAQYAIDSRVEEYSKGSGRREVKISIDEIKSRPVIDTAGVIQTGEIVDTHNSIDKCVDNILGTVQEPQ